LAYYPEPVARLIQSRSAPDPGTFIGRGKIEPLIGDALLGRASRHSARVVAVAVAPEARSAHREQPRATAASLEAKCELGVHRPAVATPTNLPTSPAASIVSSKPVSIG